MRDGATVQNRTAMDRPVRQSRGRFPGWRRGVVILAVAAAIWLGWRLLPESGSTNIAATDVRTCRVTRAPFADVLPVRTTVAPARTTLVGTQEGGQVRRLIVQDGVHVVAGQPLATLSNPQLKLDVSSREAAIAGQLGDLSGQDLTLERNRLDRASQADMTQYDLIKARRELAIRQQLHDKGLISPAGLTGVREEFEYQQQRLATLEAGKASEDRIAARQAARLSDSRARLLGTLGEVRMALDALTIRAPVTGRLTSFALQPGQMLKAGDPVGQIDSEAEWKLVADVDEYYLGRVAVGQRASGSSDRADDLPLTVTKVLPAVANGRFRIELGFRGVPPPGFHRGQTLDARVTLGDTHPALVAATGGWIESSGGSFAFVLDSDGRTARRRAVRTGRRNPNTVEILSGLAAGDRIIVSDLSPYAKASVLNLR